MHDFVTVAAVARRAAPRETETYRLTNELVCVAVVAAYTGRSRTSIAPAQGPNNQSNNNNNNNNNNTNENNNNGDTGLLTSHYLEVPHRAIQLELGLSSFCNQMHGKRRRR